MQLDNIHNSKTFRYGKVCVDVLDQMARYYTSRSATKQGPVAVFFNKYLQWTNCACINSYHLLSNNGIEVVKQTVSI